MTFDDDSQYYRTQKILFDGVETLGVWDPPDFLKQRPNEEYIKRYLVTNQNEGRPDLIANVIYGNPRLDWVLIAFNNARNVLNWPKAGETIEYPSEIVVEPAIS